MNPQILKTERAFTCFPSVSEQIKYAVFGLTSLASFRNTSKSIQHLSQTLNLFMALPGERGRGRRYSPSLAVSVRPWACARQSYTPQLYSITDVQVSHRKQNLRKDITIISLQFLLDGDVFKEERYSSTWSQKKFKRYSWISFLPRFSSVFSGFSQSHNVLTFQVISYSSEAHKKVNSQMLHIYTHWIFVTNPQSSIWKERHHQHLIRMD